MPRSDSVTESSLPEDLLARLVHIADEHMRWHRAAVLPEVRRTVDQALTTTQMRRAYEMCDGETRSNEIAKAVNTSKQSFSGWTRWRDLGIAYETSGRRLRHLTSLRSLGLPLELDDRRSPRG